jgi:hypothetical protein
VYGTINAAAGHQITEGRWIRDRNYTAGLVRFWIGSQSHQVARRHVRTCDRSVPARDLLSFSFVRSSLITYRVLFSLVRDILLLREQGRPPWGGGGGGGGPPHPRECS